MTARNALAATIFPLFLLAPACGARPSPIPDAVDAIPELHGPYLGQSPPGAEPAPFAEGIVSTGLYERDLAMTPDGAEIYYCVVLGSYLHSAIVVTRLEEGGWTEPRVAEFSGRHDDLEPAISPDGSRFFFISKRPREVGGKPREDFDIWVMDRLDDGWGEPRNLGGPVNTDGDEYFPSVTRDATLYFSRDTEGGGSAIYRSRRLADGYEAPAPLGPQVNSAAAQFNAFVAPDESYLIFGAAGRDDSVGGIDYYVAFRDDAGWHGPINLGSAVNTASNHEYSPYVSPDGRYFFFMSTRVGWKNEGSVEGLTYERIRRLDGEPGNGFPDIWWVEAGFIEALRPAEPSG